ncbi:MAG TPA: hypothetical protein VEK11_16725 [Thermoanaerobaculia bacterium]|nr:hypothetical protein [Thermoanaerobaculia bacterium]
MHGNLGVVDFPVSCSPQAAEKTYAALPDDPEAAAFYALAHLAVTPSDTMTRANAERAEKRARAAR